MNVPAWASTPQFWLSLALAAAGCSGMILAGKGRWHGWALGLAIQPVWAVFGIITGAYGLIITSALYAWVYWRNLARWRKEVKTMGLTKFGTGAVLPEPDDVRHIGAKDEDLAAALAAENEAADGDPGR